MEICKIKYESPNKKMLYYAKWILSLYTANHIKPNS